MSGVPYFVGNRIPLRPLHLWSPDVDKQVTIVYGPTPDGDHSPEPEEFGVSLYLRGHL